MREGLVHGCDYEIMGDLGQCVGCLLGKGQSPPHPRVDPALRAQEPFGRVYMDLAGPFKPKSLGGASYNLFLVDEYTRYNWAIPLKDKVSTELLLKEWVVG